MIKLEKDIVVGTIKFQTGNKKAHLQAGLHLKQRWRKNLPSGLSPQSRASLSSSNQGNSSSSHFAVQKGWQDQQLLYFSKRCLPSP